MISVLHIQSLPDPLASRQILFYASRQCALQAVALARGLGGQTADVKGMRICKRPSGQPYVQRTARKTTRAGRAARSKPAKDSRQEDFKISLSHLRSAVAALAASSAE